MSIRILILEDDQNLGKTLSDLFTSQHEAVVQVTHTAEEAEHLMSFEAFDLLIVDLVLPQVNGLDFLKNIIQKKYLHSECVVWCISGILEKNIIPREVIKYVDSFFKKATFNIDRINQVFRDTFHSAKYKKYFKFFYMEPKSNISYTTWLDHCKTVEPHHLMFIYLHLCNNGFSGTLEITSATNTPCKIFFKEGKIFHIKMDQIQLGQLLMEHNLISSKDIKTAIEQKGDMPLGRYLVSQCLVSPHAMQEMLKKQLSLGLSKTMQGNSVHLRYFDTQMKKDQEDNIYVDLDDLMPMLDNWMFSKVSLTWMRDFFKKHQDRTLNYLGNDVSIKYNKGKSRLFESVFMNPIQKEMSVQELMNSASFKTDNYVREMYYRLMIKNCCLSLPSETISHIKASRDQYILHKKLTNFIKSAQSKNYFELFGLPNNVSNAQLKNKYFQLIKACHPDYRQGNCPDDLQKLYNESLVIINEAYKTLIDSDKRQQYMEKLSSAARSALSSITKEYQQAKRELKNGDYEQSFHRFNKVLQSNQAPKDAILFWMWADLKKDKELIDKQKQKTFAAHFDSVSMEHQQAYFFFVKGLFMKQSGKTEEAMTCFNKALLIDPRMIEARQERYSLKLNKQKKPQQRTKRWFFKSSA